MSNKAAFLDRDGTIIPEAGARTADPDVEPLPEAIEAVKKLRAAGFLVVVITNQSGVARGYFTEEELSAMHEALRARFAEAGAPIDAVYYCPHLPDAERPEYAMECDCRKPQPGLLLRAARDHDIDLAGSYVVGDSERDIQAGQAAGCRGTALIRPGQQAPLSLDVGATPQWEQMMEEMNEAFDSGADAIVPDADVAADWIIDMENVRNG